LANVIEAHIYFEEPSGDFPYVFPWDDILNNTGITLSTGEQMLINHYPATNGADRILVENLYFDGTYTTYGGVLGACLVYDNGTKAWVSEVSLPSYHLRQQNINVAIGDWVDGLSYNQAVSSPNYLDPIIGQDGDKVIFAFGDPVGHACDITFNPTSLDLVVGEGTKTVSVSHGANTPVSHQWTVDQNRLQIVSSNESSITLEGLQAGTEIVTLTVNYGTHSCSKDITVSVTEKIIPTCQTNISPAEMYVVVGDVAEFTSSQDNTSGIKSFTWNFDDAAFDVNVETANRIELTTKNKGTYAISYQVENIDGSICSGQAALHISEPAAPPSYTDPVEPAPPTEPDCGEPTVIGSQPVYQLLPFKVVDPMIKIPNIMKRNARFRGHRESEKTLYDHQEQIFEIRQNWEEINNLTNLKDSTVKGWFHGEPVKLDKNLTITQSKTFQASSDKSRYPLIKDGTVRSFTNVVVKLDGIVINPLDYFFSQGDLVYTSPSSTPQTLTISYTAKIDLPQDFNKGIYNVKKRLQALDERIAEAERRYQDIENAYN
jgi:hypothetical protein